MSKTVILSLILSLIPINAIAKINSQAIEKSYNTCMNSANSASIANMCTEGAIKKYVSKMNQTQKRLFNSRADMCISKYGHPSYQPASDAATPLECIYNAAKYTLR